MPFGLGNGEWGMGNGFSKHCVNAIGTPLLITNVLLGANQLLTVLHYTAPHLSNGIISSLSRMLSASATVKRSTGKMLSYAA